jgi:hypothetical protein
VSRVPRVGIVVARLADVGEHRRNRLSDEVSRDRRPCARSARSVLPEVALVGDYVEFARPPFAVPDALNCCDRHGVGRVLPGNGPAIFVTARRKALVWSEMTGARRLLTRALPTT